MNEENACDERLLAAIESGLPSYFKRAEVETLTRGLLKPRALANMTADGSGPPVRYMGKYAMYLREEFIAWMRNYYGGMDVDTTGFGRRLHSGESTKSGVGSPGEGA